MEVNIQKIENSLNLALDATEEEFDKSYNLRVGYNEKEKTWSVIVKYSGEMNKLIDKDIQVIELLNEYAIMILPSSKIDYIASFVEVEYIEKPKKLFFEHTIGQLTSCIKNIQSAPSSLTGKGVIVGILDSGIDYKNREFRKSDGTTRILNIWDQTVKGNPPKGYLQGTEYSEEEINQALENAAYSKLVVTQDISGHGTEVTAIAAGNTGVAPEVSIIVVKLGVPEEAGFPRTIELMQGLDYLVKKSGEYKMPLVVNISFGNTYGSHDGSGLLERYIDDVSNYWKNAICVGSGNEGNVAGHVTGFISNNTPKKIELVVDRRQLAFDMQLWKYYEDTIDVIIITPNGERIGPIPRTIGKQKYQYADTEILLYYGEPSPYSILQEIYFEFIPRDIYVNTGIWEIELRPITIVTGRYNLWLPSSVVLNEGTQFNQSNAQGTLTIPSTASRVITVGAYDATTFTYADFSGRGMSDNPRLVKPDILAPGVRVMTTTVGGSNKLVTGTSFATPFVTGSAALLMEWGIVEGNDKFLYGEKIKAYFRKGAQPLPGYTDYPNEITGYGRLCVEESIPF